MSTRIRQPQEDCGEDFNVTVARLHHERLWRPTVGIVLTDDQGRVGIGRQNNPEQNWSIIQGGIHDLEPVLNAAYRELREELGLRPRDVKLVEPQLHTGYVEFTEDTITEGFSRGKWYGIMGMRLCRSAQVILEPTDGSLQEILEWRWEFPDKAIRYCVEQPGVTEPKPGTLDKGRRILAPAIRRFQGR